MQVYFISFLLNINHIMRAYVGVEVQPHLLLNSVLDVGEWRASRPVRFVLEEKNFE